MAPSPLPLLLSYLAFLSIGLPDSVLGVAWPSLQSTFALAPSALGAVLGCSMGGYLSSGLGAGATVARLGVGNALSLSSALVAVALLGYAVAPSWPLFFPFGAVLGLGSGAIDAALNLHAAKHFSVKHVNWLHACWGIGASLGPLVMTAAVTRQLGFRGGYALLSATLACLTLMFLVTREHWGAAARREQRGPSPSAAAGARRVAEPAARAAAPDQASAVGMGAALRQRPLLLQLLLFLLYGGAESTTGQWCFTWLMERHALSAELSGGWTSAYWASLTVGRLALGAVVDRVGPDRLLRAATLGCLTGAALFALAPGGAGRSGLLILGVSLAPLFPTLMARTPARVGARWAHHAVGLQVSAATIGSAALPSLTGFLVTRFGVGLVGASAIATTAGLLSAHELLLRMTARDA